MEDDEVDFAKLRKDQQDMLAYQYNHWMTTLPRLPGSPISFYEKVTVDEYMTVTIGEWGGYLIQVMAMGFNNRIVLVPQAFRGVIDYGWCYDRGQTAMMAALIWNPDTEGEPAGYKKISGVGGRQAGQRAGLLTANSMHGLDLMFIAEMLGPASELGKEWGGPDQGRPGQSQ